jgi:hypothetical protein
LTQIECPFLSALNPDESEGCSPVVAVVVQGCSPVSGGRTIRLCSSWPSDDPPTPLRSSVDTGAGIDAEPLPSLQWWQRLSAVERMLARWSSGEGESNLRTQKICQPVVQIWRLSVKSHSGIAPDPSFQPRGCNAGLTKSSRVPRGTRGHPIPRRVRCPPDNVCSKSVEHL